MKKIIFVIIFILLLIGVNTNMNVPSIDDVQIEQNDQIENEDSIIVDSLNNTIDIVINNNQIIYEEQIDTIPFDHSNKLTLNLSNYYIYNNNEQYLKSINHYKYIVDPNDNSTLDVGNVDTELKGRAIYLFQITHKLGKT